MKIQGEEFIEEITSYFNRKYSYSEIRQLMKKHYQCEISRIGLLRLLKKYNLRRKNIEESNPVELMTAIEIELEGSGLNLGYRAMHRRIESSPYNLRAKERTVLSFMRVLDPLGVESRRKRKLQRRRYKAQGPNFVWHMDGHAKLSRFGFPIHGAIYGFSRKVLWLEVATTNNNPHVIAHHYLKTVKKLKCCPSIIRCDKGTENVQVEALQIAFRHLHNDEFAAEKSFIVGKSTHNQRIEAFWVHIQRLCTAHYMDLFKELQEQNVLNITNKLQLECLRYSFGPLIRYDVYRAADEWNNHKVREQKSKDILGGKPNILYELPQNYGAYDRSKTVDDRHVDIFMDKFSEEPKLYHEQFERIFKMIGLKHQYPPSTTKDALQYFKELWEAVSSILED